MQVMEGVDMPGDVCEERFVPDPDFDVDRELQRCGGIPPENVERVVVVGHVFHFGSPESAVAAAHERLRKALLARAKTRRNWEVTLRHGAVPAELARSFQLERVGVADLLAALPEEKSVAALEGRPFAFVEGVEQNHIKDHDVELSMGQTAGNPRIGTVFSGVSFTGTLIPSGKSRMSLTGRYLETAAEISPVDIQFRATPDVDVSRVRFVRRQLHGVELVPGTWYPLVVQVDGKNAKVVLLRVDPR